MKIKCEHCDNEQAKLRVAATAYSYSRPISRFSYLEVDATEEEIVKWHLKHNKDPNRPLWLCDGCAEDYYEHWDEMWQEYYSGLL